jgi:hypothetical protein
MKIRCNRFNEVSIRESIEVFAALVPHEIGAWNPNPELRYSRQKLQRILFDERSAGRARVARDLHRSHPDASSHRTAIRLARAGHAGRNGGAEDPAHDHDTDKRPR